MPKFEFTAEKTGRCHSCSDKTNKISIDYNIYICSDKCFDKITDELTEWEAKSKCIQE